jgi:hypothetical protein
MVADKTPHRARRVDENGWAISFLRGRTLTTEQAMAAMQAAEIVAHLHELARLIYLTPLEIFGLATDETPWESDLFPENKYRIR